jgi:hypothetical protein
MVVTNELRKILVKIIQSCKNEVKEIALPIILTANIEEAVDFQRVQRVLNDAQFIAESKTFGYDRKLTLGCCEKCEWPLMGV